METALLYLGYVALILFLGVLSAIIARRIRIPSILLLIFVGVLLGSIRYYRKPLVEFGPGFITSISIIALILIVFDASARFKFKEFDTLSLKALKLSIIFLTLNAIILSFAMFYLFKPKLPFLALLFATAMSGTSPASVLVIFKGIRNRLFHFLEIESILNTPLIVLIPFILIDIFRNISIETITIAQLSAQLWPFLQKFVTGIGAGVLLGLILLKAMRKAYSPTLSPLAVMTAAIATYVIAEYLGGNGVLAVTTIGLFFGNVYIQHKRKLLEFSAAFSTVLEILVFVLIGFAIQVPFTKEFFIKSLQLFAVFLGVRFLAVNLSFGKAAHYTFKEKLFMTLHAPKGIGEAVVALVIMGIAISDIGLIASLIFSFIIYSIVLATVVLRFSKFFIAIEYPGEKEA